MINWFKKLFKRKPHIPLLDFRGEGFSYLSSDRRDDSMEFLYVKSENEKVYRVSTRGGAYEEVIYYEEVGN